MNLTQTTRRIHPLMAGAAVSVTLVSLLGVAALTGILPNSHALSADPVQTAAPAQAPASVVHKHPVTAVRKNAPVYAQAQTQQTQQAQPQVQYPQQVSQPAPAPAPAPVARNSPVGIGLGAVIGGVLGSQVGSGDGKTLATIAGAIGGGYLGNEVAKKNQ
jgi:uncharacterized protein YcfJ